MTNIAIGWNRARGLYNEFPSQFWVLVYGTFIDRLGGALLFPFFTLYLTQKFGIGMTDVGLIFGLYSVSSLAGSVIGGALTDRLGRKGMLLLGLVMSALSSLLMGVINAIQLFFVVILFVGILAEVGGPAQQALVADLLPEEQRAQGFGILRVVVNLSVTIGPLIGGLIASRSFLLLFICDAVTSLITAAFIFITLKETHLHKIDGEAEPSVTQTFRGYFDVMRDQAFVWFLGASMLMVVVYIQMNTTLAVYLRDVHGVSVKSFGYILSLNAAMVVLFQFSVTRWVGQFRPLIVMVGGTLLYALGFAMYGFVSWYGFFLLAMAIITVGEMMVSPVSQAIIARLAPEEMRGRYMAVYGFSWVLPIAIGPFLAGLVMDNANSNWVWYGAGLIGLVAAGVFYLLELRVDQSKWSVIDKRLEILEELEGNDISAEEASILLSQVSEGQWDRLSPTDAEALPERRHLNIRVSDLATGAMKVDLRLPIGLVNTILYTGGHLTTDMKDFDLSSLKKLISEANAQNSTQHLDAGDDHLEISMD